MTDSEKIAIYEMQITDMLLTIQARYNEIAETDSVSEFEQGRKLAYFEVIDIIRNRYKILLDMLEEVAEGEQTQR